MNSSSSSALQSALVRILSAEGALPAPVPVIAWRRKDQESDLDAKLAVQRGLCLFVPMPIPTSAMQGTPDVFFDGYEVRVQIVEMPSMNRRGPADLYDMIDAVALALHWQPKTQDSPLYGILAHPLYLASRPVETAEGILAIPGFEHNGEEIRGADIIFNAVLQLNNTTEE